MPQPDAALDLVQQSLDELRDRLVAIEDSAMVEKYADSLAIGVWADELSPSDPTRVDLDAAGMVVIVYEGAIYHVSISDYYLTVTPDVLTNTFNAVVRNAYVVWQSQREKLIAEGERVLAEHGERDGAKILRDRIGPDSQA